MGRTLKKFNPIDMSREDVMALATGREKLLKTMMAEMKHSVQSKTSQHFVLSGPRGIGKSFFIRLLNIHHDDSEKFKNSIFIQFPEELDNIRYVSDLMDKIANKLEGGFYVDSKPRWEMNEAIWNASKKRLIAALKKITKDKKEHVFIGLENLQDFIPKLDDMENGRMREFLSDYPQVTLIGSSLRPDLDSNYNKKLFQVFKKIDITPWGENDFIEFYKKKADLSPNSEAQKHQLSISKNKIRAIATFTGGSPRLAVILSSLVLDQKILETAALLDNILDDLTAFYQDLTKDIPPKSKALFDMLIRIGENVTQSELAQSFTPPLEQKTISRSFKWLLDNYYVVNKKQARGNAKHYHVRDRLYVLYYQKRQVFADQLTSFVEVFVDFLTEYFSVKEWREQLEVMDMANPYSKRIMLCYSERRGLKMDERADSEFIRSRIISDIENEDLKDDDRLMIVLEEFVKITPNDANAYFNLGNTMYHLGDYIRAIRYYRQVIQLNPKDADAYNNLGIAMAANGDKKGAIKSYKKAIELNPKDEKFYNNLGIAMSAIGENMEAITYYEKAIKSNPKNAMAYNNLGAVLYSTGDNTEAIDKYKKAIELNPNYVNAYFNLGIVMSDIGDKKGAAQQYEEVIKLDSKDVDAHFNLGATMLGIGNYIKAVEQYEKVLELDPKNADAYFNLGVANYNMEDNANAVKHYEKTLELNPEHAMACFNLGVVMCEMGDQLDGIKHYEKAIKLDPKYAKAYNNLGVMLMDIGDKEKAIKMYEKTLELDPKDVNPYLNLGHMHFKEAQWGNSEYWIEQGVNAVPSDKMLIQKLFELYLIQSKWQAISQFNQKIPDGITKDKLLGRALGEAIAHEQVESFLLFKQTLDFIQDKHPEWLIGFVISLTMHLYVGEKKELLDSFVDELGASEDSNPFLNIILECWKYLQNPENQDISKLHPDARLVANRILDLGKVD